jgi:hypothetical protein
MTKLSTIFFTITLALIGNQALANPNHVVKERDIAITTQSTDSKESAYQNAQLKLIELKESSPKELKEQLNVFSAHYVEDSVRLQEGAYITAQEYINEDGEVQYKGLVNASYEYKYVEWHN